MPHKMIARVHAAPRPHCRADRTSLDEVTLGRKHGARHPAATSGHEWCAILGHASGTVVRFPAYKVTPNRLARAKAVIIDTTT